MDRFKAYDLLGLPGGAGEDEIKAAYRALAQKYNVDSYEAGPLRDQAEQKMAEINDAFDSLMSYIRTGQTETGTAFAAAPQGTGASNSERYPAIRQRINAGEVDAALEELGSIPGGAADAEWNFLMGSVYYHKGWLDQALFYFQKAVQLAPGNREYEAALQNLQRSATGNMQGNPYGEANPAGTAASCACNTCAMMCCMDACCGMCRGF